MTDVVEAAHAKYLAPPQGWGLKVGDRNLRQGVLHINLNIMSNMIGYMVTWTTYGSAQHGLRHWLQGEIFRFVLHFQM